MKRLLSYLFILFGLGIFLNFNANSEIKKDLEKNGLKFKNVTKKNKKKLPNIAQMQKKCQGPVQAGSGFIQFRFRTSRFPVPGSGSEIS